MFKGTEYFQKANERINRVRQRQNKYSGSGTIVGAATGTGTGLVAGVVVPLYVGAALVDYACEAAGIPSGIKYPADIVGACVTLGLIGGVSIPVLTAIGTVVGGVSGFAIEKTRNGLERLAAYLPERKPTNRK